MSIRQSLLRFTRSLSGRLHLQLGRVWLLLGRTDRAKSEFQEVLQQRGDDFYAYLHLGKLALLEGDVRTAMREIGAARRMNPERFARVRTRLGAKLAGVLPRGMGGGQHAVSARWFLPGRWRHSSGSGRPTGHKAGEATVSGLSDGGSGLSDGGGPTAGNEMAGFEFPCRPWFWRPEDGPPGEASAAPRRSGWSEFGPYDEDFWFGLDADAVGPTSSAPDPLATDPLATDLSGEWLAGDGRLSDFWSSLDQEVTDGFAWWQEGYAEDGLGEDAFDGGGSFDGQGSFDGPGMDMPFPDAAYADTPFGIDDEDAPSWADSPLASFYQELDGAEHAPGSGGDDEASSAADAFGPGNPPPISPREFESIDWDELAQQIAELGDL